MEEGKAKRFKDPVYGYIKIPYEYIKNIIDTSVFQRLRRVIQTSYTPLYSSTLHNRFVHSIGVFNLGRIAAEELKKEIVKKKYYSEKKIEKYIAVFEIACLLHDVGHAPFSHTGEIYYKNGNFQVVDLHKRLCELVGTKDFKKDLPVESESAAPHEIMSAIIGIKEFGNYIGNSELKDFFARCITGYKYKESSDLNEIKNCFILMLNSKVIDVDKLDYLIRDAYTSGFNTVNIDYIRLLNSLTIIKIKGQYNIAYKKSAISVIENVVYAHDAERKWIQNHPIVVYESYIIKHMLEHLNESLNGENAKLFSEKTLSKEGNVFNDNIKVSLFSDDDVIYLSKNVFPDKLSGEFFDRNKRRYPVWKSEAEYSAYISGLGGEGGKFVTDFRECMNSFNESRSPEHPIPMVINDDLIAKLEQQLNDGNMDDIHLMAVKQQLAVAKYLKKISIENNFPFDFIIIQTSMFNSNFSKKHLSEIFIDFDDTDENIHRLGDVCNILKSDSEDRDFYYLYYRKVKSNDDNSGIIKDVRKFCDGLYKAVINVE